jgi:hypothetical protein
MKTTASAALAALLLAAAPALRAEEPAPAPAAPKDGPSAQEEALRDLQERIRKLDAIMKFKAEEPAPAPAAPKDGPSAQEKALRDLQERIRAQGASPAMEDAIRKLDAIVKFRERLKAHHEQDAGKPQAKLTLDGRAILQVPGNRIETVFEGEGAERVMIVKLDGKEISRVPLPQLDIDPSALPPLAFPDIEGVSTKVESQSVNGVSTARVWVNGKLVYQGLGGGNVSATSNSSDGRTFVEVKIDGRVVYRAGEGKGAEPRKSGKKAE